MKPFTAVRDALAHPIVAIPKTKSRGGMRLSLVPAAQKEPQRRGSLHLLRVKAHSGASYSVVLGEGKSRKHRR